LKKIILSSLIEVCFLGNCFSQNLNTQTLHDTVINGKVIGNPDIHHEKDGSTTLGPTVGLSMCGLNYVQSSVLIETRSQPWNFNTNGTGFPCHMPIAGLSSCDSIVKAYIWWLDSYTAACVGNPVVSLTNPAAVTANYTATSIGTSGSKCWAESGTNSFRVDVTAAISGNGTYTINSITGACNSAWEVDGATLVIIYKDPAATYVGNLYIADGCYVGPGGFGTVAYTLGGFNVCAVPITATAFSVVTDMQSNVAACHDATLNNTLYTCAFPNSFYNWDAENEVLTVGQTTDVAGYSTFADCYAWLLTGLYYQTNCVGCTPPVLTVTATMTPSLCNGNNGTATAHPVGGTGPYTYSWNTNPVQTTQTAVNLAPGTYSVTVTDACGNQGIATITVTTTSALTVTFATTNVSCFGLSTGQIIADTTSANLPPYTFLWSPTGGNGLTAQNLAAGTYTLSVTDNSGCVQVDTVSVTQPPLLTVTTGHNTILCFGLTTGADTANVVGGTPNYTYLWSPAGGNVATAVNLGAGSYTVTITDANGCTASSSNTITQPTALTNVVSPPVTICVGQNTIVTSTPGGGTPGYTYSWSNGNTTNSQTVNPIVTTIYNVTVTDANGCTITGSTTVTVNPPLSLVVSLASVICEGQTASISATGSGGDGVYTYTWTNGVGPGAGPFIVSPLVTTTYVVVLTDNCGSTPVTDSVTVTVDPAPIVNFTGTPLKGCSPLTVQFTDQTVSQFQITSRVWNFGDGSPVSDSTNPIHVYITPGSYSVTETVAGSSNCVSSLTDSAMVTVYPNPIAGFLVNPPIASILNPLINIKDESTGGSVWSYTFGDGGSSNLQNPNHSYTDTGTFWISQIVWNQWGCVDSIRGTVIITPDYAFYIPNAFTPGATNDLNTTFQGYGTGIIQYEMSIFNRWGEQIFYTVDMNKPWDGTYNGSDVKQDVYVYEIRITDQNHQAHKYAGKVTLIR